VPQAERGQPFTGVPGLRFSIGDVFATAGTVAAQGVLVAEPPLDVPPSNIVQAGDPVTLTTLLRAAALGPWLDPAVTSAVLNHHITNVDTGAIVGVFPGGPIVPTPPPAGDSGPQPGEVVSWFSATSPQITLGPDTYRILTHVHGTGPYAQFFGGFIDNTYVHVLPG
jgi:hypothetical protein